MDNRDNKKQPVTPAENTPVDMNFERMFKNFVKTVRNSGVLEQVKARRYYIKPSELKRMAKKSKRR